MTTILLDPTENPLLRDLAELSGASVRHCTRWPFDVTPQHPVVSTVPIPRSHAPHALGVLTGVACDPGTGEAWPDRTVTLEDHLEEVMAFLAGAAHASPRGPRGALVGVWGLRGGLGTSTFAAGFSRTLAGEPLAVAHVESDPVSVLWPFVRDQGRLAWADLAGETGPLLPGRLEASLPVWERVRVLVADGRGGPVRVDAAVEALRTTHDVVVHDVGRTPPVGATARVPVLTGSRIEVEALGRLVEGAEAPTVAVVRAGGEITAAEVALHVGIPAVHLGTERGAGAAARHGVAPGDRPRGATSRAAREVAAHLGLVG